MLLLSVVHNSELFYLSLFPRCNEKDEYICMIAGTESREERTRKKKKKKACAPVALATADDRGEVTSLIFMEDSKE